MLVCIAEREQSRQKVNRQQTIQRLELIPKVQVEVWLLRAVAIAKRGTYRTYDCVIVVSALNAEQRLVVEEFFQFL